MSLTSLNIKQLLNSLLFHLRADNAQPAGDGRAAAADVALAGDVVEVDPAAVGRVDEALCAEDDAVLFLVAQPGENVAQIAFAELFRRLDAPGGEHLVGVVVMLVVVAAAAVLIVLVVVLMMIMSAAAVLVVLMVMMLVVLW